MDDREIDPRFKATPEADEDTEEQRGPAPSVKEAETEADEELPGDQDTFQTDSS